MTANLHQVKLLVFLIFVTYLQLRFRQGLGQMLVEFSFASGFQILALVCSKFHC